MATDWLTPLAEMSLVPPPPRDPTSPTALAPASPPTALAAEGSPAATNSSVVGVGEVLYALRRCWFLALSTSVCSVAVVSVAIWLLLKPSCTARSTLVVSTTPPKIVFTTSDNAGESRADFANYQKTQASLIKSRLVLNAALRQPTISELSIVRQQPDPTEWLEKELKVENPGGTELLQISLQGDRPDELMAVVNAVTEAYMREIINKEKLKRLTRLQQLKEIYNKSEDSLRGKRRTLKELAENAGSGDVQTLTQKHLFALEQLNATKKDLMQYRSERRRLEAELAVNNSLDLGKQSTVSDEGVEQRLGQDPVVARYLQRQAQLEEKIEATKNCSSLGEADPSLASPKKELAEVKQALAKRRQELAAAQNQTTRDRYLERIRVLKDLEKVLSDEVANYTEETQTINKSSLDLGSLRDDVAKDELVNNKIAGEMEALKVEIQAPSRVTLMEEASISSAGAEKKRLMALGGGAAGALALSLFGVCFFELRLRRITQANDVVDHLGMRLMGSIPYLHRQGRRHVGPADGDPDPVGQKLLTDSIDAVRTMVLYQARVESLRVVMVTSAVSGEGKTSVACQLAASLARAGRKTVLVDCDMRKPGAHRVFGLPMGPGFSAMVQGNASLADVLQPTSVEGLSLIPAGVYDPGALRALAQDGARHLFDRLRQEFDFVLIDSSPILPVVDALLIAQQADGVLFSLLQDVSQRPLAEAALKKLQTLGVRLLGAIVSGSGSNLGYDQTY